MTTSATGPSEETPTCPLDDTHDRLIEANYFLHRMCAEYHDPAQFRYNTNAFLSALKSTTDILNIEMQRKGQGAWYAGNKASVYTDPVLDKFMRGRNIVLHQRPLLRGSRLESGLFRGYKLKTATQSDVSHDRTSEDILTNILIPQMTGFLIDEEHMAIDEQLGVRRIYFVKELGDDDVLSASLTAYARMTQFVARAHSAFELQVEGLDEANIVAAVDLASVTTLLEGDLDPDAYGRWGWE